MAGTTPTSSSPGRTHLRALRRPRAGPHGWPGAPGRRPTTRRSAIGAAPGPAGAAASALGDGISAVAIAWLALRLAPEPSRGLLVGAAVAAYLSGAIGAVALRRWLGGRGGARLTFVNAVLRAAALGLIACLALAGLLGPAGYVALLGVSSVLSA